MGVEVEPLPPPQPPPVPLERRASKISEMVARRIVHDIAAQSLQPHAKLPPEADMIQHYQVSRASLREALRILEVHGVIVIKPGPGGGPVIAGVDSRDFGRMATLFFHLLGATFRDLLEARVAMEPFMARLAAERQDPAAMRQLDAFIALGDDVPENEAEYLQTAGDFHGMIAGISGNPILDVIGRALKDVYLDRIRGANVSEPLDRRQIVAEHLSIAKAIRAGSAAKAERLAREHLDMFALRAAERNSGMLDEVVDWQ